MMTREQYLFQCLAEELGEVAKECLKASRFGPLCNWYRGETNLNRLNTEWSQVKAIMDLIEAEFGYRFITESLEVEKKKLTFEQFYEHSSDLGMVEAKPSPHISGLKSTAVTVTPAMRDAFYQKARVLTTGAIRNLDEALAAVIIARDIKC
jgi:hypothetical protein